MLNLYTESGTPARQARTTRIRHDDRLASLIDRAALALGVDKSVFLRVAIEREARRVLDRQSRHTLTPEDAGRFAEALDTPPAPTPRALEAARNYRAHGCSCRLSIRPGATAPISTAASATGTSVWGSASANGRRMA